MKPSARRIKTFQISRYLFLISALYSAADSAFAQTQIQSFTGVIEGHEVGGVTINFVGNIYVSDFGDIVWKITPEGKLPEFASGLYGSSGNAIDHEGNLLQSNFYGDSITKIDRKGQTAIFARTGLNRLVGIAIDQKTSDVFVAAAATRSQRLQQTVLFPLLRRVTFLSVQTESPSITEEICT